MKYKIKILIISLFIFLVYPFCDTYASSAYLFFSDIPKSMKVGDSFTTTLKVKSEEQAINAVSGVVYFSDDTLELVSVSKNNSIVNIWTKDKEISKNNIGFEGIILNPGYLGTSGDILNITFLAKKHGLSKIGLSEGSVLANDGLGTNILSSLKSTTFDIDDNLNFSPANLIENRSEVQDVILPTIIEYPQSTLSKDGFVIKGKGGPNIFTKLSFEDVSTKSFGEQFISYLQTKKSKPTDIIVKNDIDGNFTYVSPSNLIAGAYNITPHLVGQDNGIEKPGQSVQLLVNDNKLIHYIIILINILILLIPIVILVVIIYFIPWYSFLRMRIIKKKISIEEEKIESSEQIKREDNCDCSKQ